jgi:ribosomal protein RSM22 (predicted rRNA methylase)
MSSYLEDEKLIAAYVHMYFMTYLPKMRQAIDYLGEDFKEVLSSHALLDIGAGPGTLYHALELTEHKKLYAEETSKLMVEVGQKLAEHESLDIKWNKRVNEKDLCVFFTHSLNEMGLAEGLEYIEAHDPSEIVFIEPGTKESFKLLLAMREKLMEIGYEINYPCHKSAACPLNENDWCHQVMHVTHPQEVERLCQILKLDRRVQPVCLQWFSKIKREKKGSTIFRRHKETKFSFEYEVCTNNEIEYLQIMKKTLEKKQIKQIRNLAPGDTLVFELDKQLGDGKKRVKLIS